MRNAKPMGSSEISLPPKTYIYKIEPILTKLAVISSDDSLRFVDSSTLQVESNGIRQGVHAGVTSLVNKLANNTILTAGRDGLIRIWDSRHSVRISEFGGGRDARPILSLAANSSSRMIAVGTELANSLALVQLWDSRSHAKPLCEYTGSHNDDITQLAFHPTDPKVLLSGSTDGLVNIYDTTISDEDDVLLQVFNHGASIAHTAFLSEKQLFALSHDEKFTVYGLTYQDDCPESLPNEFGDLRPRLGCEYVCGFSISSDGNAIVGAGSQREHRMDLIPLGAKEEWIFAKEHAIRLEGAHGEDIVRTFSIDEKSSVIYSGGEDGRLRAFRPEIEAPETETGQGASAKPKKSKECKGKERCVKPY